MGEGVVGSGARGSRVRGGQRTAGLVAATVVLGVALGACDRVGDMDWDLRRNGFTTSAAARAAAAERPQPDARGVITYPGYQVVVAQRGESLQQIATRLGLDIGELARTNALTADSVLRGGEVLVLPGGSAPPLPGAGTGAIAVVPLDPVTDAAPALAAPAGSEPIRHTVRRGETVFTIARLYNLPARTLADWNGLPADMAVREGQVLLVPVPQSIADAAAAAPVPAPAPAPAVPVAAAMPGAPLPDPVPAPAPAAAAAAAPAPGRGSPTPPPPSASTPLPATDPAPAGAGAAAVAGTGAVPAPAPAPVADMAAQRTERARLAMPVQGRVIRAYQRGRNDGIGIGAPAGTEVRAAAAGTVAAITRDTDQVPILVVRHENNLLTVYANIDDIRVERGARVSRGQVLATVRRGDPSFLHFEVREGFESVDPMPFLQ